jgi:AraC family ethanolamine operon transcriptional activator
VTCETAGVVEAQLDGDIGDLPASSRLSRAWALDEARRRLLASGPADRTVTTIAAGLSFGHLGRFAGYYRQIFGESPR